MWENHQVELPVGGLRSRLESADPLALLVTTTHLTGDLGLLRPEWRPDMSIGAPGKGYSAETRSDILRTCLAALERAGRDWDRRAPGYDFLQRFLEWAMGAEFAGYAPLLADGLSFQQSRDPGEPRWRRSAIAPGRDFGVVVIGAGASGLLLAHRLRQAGVRVTVLEKNPDVGGTWYDNTYPGARVDLSSQVYRYSSHPGRWDDYFSTQPAMLDYLREFAADNGLYADIEFNSEVLSSRWDASRSVWVLRVRSAGTIREVVAAVQVSAVGQLNLPHYPDIPGVDDFEGDSFHTSRWDHSVDLTGKRVGVIGVGASAIQLVPEIAGTAAEVSVFARTMPYLSPTPHLRQPLPEGELWLLDHLPHYRAWYRAAEFLTTLEGNQHLVTVDPGHPPTERAVSAGNDQVRGMLQLWIDAQTEDDPALRAALTPDGPFGAKRWVADDGTWIATLKQPHVHLVREAVKEISSTGLRSADGEFHELDVLIYATGFRASEFLSPMRIEGRDGAELRQRWRGDDASAYLGMCVPGFPNLFSLYGPNTAIVVHAASVFFMSECEVRYVVDAVRLLLESGSASLEVREQTLDAYQRRIDEASSQRAWGFSDVHSWYKNSTGRSTQLWPLKALEFWQRTRQVDLDDFVVSPERSPYDLG